MNQNILNTLILMLALALLPAPLVYMEIGPLGKLYYGPTVPDIHIYGGWITGKDLRWQPIYFSQIFQRVCIVLYILLCVACFLSRKRITLLSISYVNLGLLLCFPFWLTFYVGHVINNSDGAVADMGIVYHYGLYLYGLLLLFHVLMMRQIYRSGI